MNADSQFHKVCNSDIQIVIFISSQSLLLNYHNIMVITVSLLIIRQKYNQKQFKLKFIYLHLHTQYANFMYIHSDSLTVDCVNKCCLSVSVWQERSAQALLTGTAKECAFCGLAPRFVLKRSQGKVWKTK